MEDASQPVVKSNKEIRAEYNSQIRNYKLEREKLSDENKKLATEIKNSPDREAKKGMHATIKTNVEKRDAISNMVKELVAKIKALRVK